MAKRAGRKRPQQVEGENLGRCLLWSLLLLLVAALLLKFHLVPAKQRLWRIRGHYEVMNHEATELERERTDLEAELGALRDDPMYQERLMRRTFRRGGPEDEVYLKERP